MAQVIPVPSAVRPPRVAWPVAALVAVLAVGVPVEHAAYPTNAAAAAGDLAVAVAFAVCGAAIWARARASDLTGRLMVATAAAWLAGGLSDDLVFLHRGPLVQLLVAAPDARPRSVLERVVVGAGYVAALAPVIGRGGVTVPFAVVVAGVALGRWALARDAQRRARAVPAAAATAIGLVLLAGGFADAADADAVLWAYEAALVATAAALLADRRWQGSPRSAVTSLVVDLGDLPRGGSLTAALAHAVGDPSLVVAYGDSASGYADEHGRPVTIPGPGAGRAVTTVDVDGLPAAVLVHDPATLRAPGLSESITAAVRLALENVRLRADISARVRDVEASRARLLQARDTERRRLEARLRAGVGRRLDATAHALGHLATDPDDAIRALGGELDRTRAELRRFTAGLHPGDLEAGGLSVALTGLAARAPLPVDVRVECGRLDERLELTAWFACAEALTNVVKHSGAARAAIRVERLPPWLVVTVDDDGRGGADPSAGHGLRGLAARAEAAGGRLEAGDRPEGGTRVRALLRERA